MRARACRRGTCGSATCRRCRSADDAFDLVTGFTSFFYAGDVVAALREAARVARPGGGPDVRPPRALRSRCSQAVTDWRPEIVEEVVPRAGLAVERSFDVEWAYEYADEATLLEGVLAGAVAAAGPDPAAVLNALAGCRQPDGSYRVANEWHVVIA